MSRLTFLASCFAGGFLSAVVVAGQESRVVAGQDWRQWRGPNRDGRATVAAPAKLAPKATELWRAPVGTGHASPVVDRGRVYVFARRGEEETAAAFDLTSGKPLWSQAYPAPYEMNPAARGHGKGPKSTPALGHGRLYTLGIGGVLSAFDAATGRLVWRASVEKEFPVTAPSFGTAMSPLVDGDAVIAHVGGPGRGALRAFEAATGRVVWSWTEDGPGYASPIIVETGGVRQIVTQTERHVVGIDRATGKTLWKTRFETPYAQNVVTPVAAGDLVILSGLDQATFAIRLARRGGTWTSERVWENPAVPMYMSSPVRSGTWLFGLTHRNRGQFFALDTRTGKTLWTSPPRQGENAAIVLAGDILVCLMEDGELRLVRATDRGYEEVGRVEVAGSPTWAHPVVLGDRVVIKDEESLALLKIG